MWRFSSQNRRVCDRSENRHVIVQFAGSQVVIAVGERVSRIHTRALLLSVARLIYRIRFSDLNSRRVFSLDQSSV